MTRPSAVLLVLLAGAACHPTRAPEHPAAEPGVGGVDLASLDRGVSPCDDFYQFACGGWLKTAQIPGDRPVWDRSFMSLEEENQQRLRQLLEADAAGQVDPRDAYADKVGTFFASCMDEAAIEKNGPAELKAELARIDKVKDVTTLASTLAQLHLTGTEALFDFSSQQDAKDATQVIGSISQGGLGLPDRDFYFRTDPKARAILAAYLGHVEKMLALAHVPRPAPRAKAIVALERRLAESHWTNVELRDPNRIFNRVELAGLEKLAPKFPWKSYFSALGLAASAINATTPKNVQAIGALVVDVPLDDWRAYLDWHLIASHASSLPKAFVDESFAFESQNLSGQKELPVRWKRCVGATDGALGEALGQSYVRRYFGGDAKQATSGLVDELERSFGGGLASLDWMDKATRASARAKLERIVNKIGYPDVWRRYDTLAVSRGSYLENQLAAAGFEARRELAKIGKPVDRKEWGMTPPTVNAYYNAQLNEMVFPAGVLQPPFFSPRAGAAVNHGALGMVVGHELTHGFDDEGRQFDGEGNLKEWWSPAVGDAFATRARCLVQQYNAYVAVDDVHVNGELTLGENIADLGGIKTAYAAYQAAAAAGHGAASAQGFTPDQQFFLGAAQIWCTKITDALARTIAQTDPHSPAKYRVNGPLSNLPAFARAFSCQDGSPMARPAAARCEVW
jgi:putative endopeptidase